MSDRVPRNAHVLLGGTVVSSGIARGTAFVCNCAEDPVVPRRPICAEEVDEECTRLECAVLDTEAEFASLRENLVGRGGGVSLQLLEAEAGLLRDPMLYDATREYCQHNRLNAEAALHDVTAELVTTFAKIDDAFFRERITDVRDVSRRVMSHLVDAHPGQERQPPPGSILVTRELLPSVAVRLDRQQIQGVIAEQGASTAHAVILARSAEIPTVIHVQDAVQRIATGDRVIVDGVSGRIFVGPSPEVEREYDHLESAFATRRQELHGLIGLPSVTRDGTAISLNANIGLIADASLAATAGSDGVGLYRTEFVFFAQDHLPSEDEQYAFYRKAADCLGGRNLVVRALDLGSDKLLPYFPMPAELNPSLGRRGTRFLLAQREILHTQLRAILRLSATHPVALLFPMIGGVDEAIEAKRAVDLVKGELRSRGAPYNPHLRIGAMIETPAAAITARHIAQEVDFLSIGTNDLVQYLLAADRTSRDLAPYYEPLHPAVVATLKSVLDLSAGGSLEVSICGEIAGNPAFTALLLGLGARSLSVAPGELLEIKSVIRATHLAEAQSLAARVLASRTIRDVKAQLAQGLGFPIQPSDPGPSALHAGGA